MTEAAVRSPGLSGDRAVSDVSMPVLVLFAASPVHAHHHADVMARLLQFRRIALAPSRSETSSTLFTDPDFLNPLFSTVIVAISSSVLCCALRCPRSPGWWRAPTFRSLEWCVHS